MNVPKEMERRNAHYLEQANFVTDRILKHRVISRRAAMKDRRGCYVYMTPISGMEHFLGVLDPSGRPSSEKTPRYVAFSQEKTSRLRRYPGLLLSYLCRDEEKEQYGGAVRGNRCFHSVSGWPQDLDEVHSLATAVRTSDLALEQAIERLKFREQVTEIKLSSGLVVPVKPNEYAKFLPDLVRD